MVKEESLVDTRIVHRFEARGPSYWNGGSDTPRTLSLNTSCSYLCLGAGVVATGISTVTFS